eukprot:TRINITY_DN33404_c0_g1_i2.p1 TRINITY_DN33404_c0_g1~~TRINITY_DN33404_c0_g1_i2.p1  ORF type:complete len:204 (+),score=-13.02 TRINITY_DN33404_c0_g1_i2:334-945(+)
MTCRYRIVTSQCMHMYHTFTEVGSEIMMQYYLFVFIRRSYLLQCCNVVLIAIRQIERLKIFCFLNVGCKVMYVLYRVLYCQIFQTVYANYLFQHKVELVNISGVYRSNFIDRRYSLKIQINLQQLYQLSRQKIQFKNIQQLTIQVQQKMWNSKQQKVKHKIRYMLDPNSMCSARVFFFNYAREKSLGIVIQFLVQLTILIAGN